MVGETGAAQRAGSAELLRRARRVMPGGVLGSYVMPDEVAFVISHGRGSKVYDLEGREYVDYILGSGPLVLGHAHPSVVEAVRRQVELGSQFYALNEPALALAEKLQAAIPCAGLVKFTSTGAEATFYALRLARAFTGRETIMRFEGGYHGHHDYSALGTTAGIPSPIEEGVVTARFNDLETTTGLIEEHRDALAAVIVEPLQRVIPPRPGFLEGLREATRRHGILLIFDEVVTGFRLAWGGAQGRYGVVPDLACYGKIIGGGYPLAAVAGHTDVMSLADPRDRGERYVYVSGTLNGNPLGAAAGLATLEVLEGGDAYERLDRTGERLRRGLREIAATLPRPVQVLGDGALAGVAFTDGDVSDPGVVAASDRATTQALERELLRRGVLANLATFKLYLSLVHDDGDLDRTLDAFEDALRRVCAG